MATKALGIFQSETILKTALMLGLIDLRANPYLLDYVFASLPQDDQTSREYGEKTVKQAKAWFLNTKIPVVMAPLMNANSEMPCITIHMADSSEAESTLGDIHYQPSEDVEDVDAPSLTSRFTPSYSSTTGIVTPAPGSTGTIVLAPGQVLVDANGVSHPILEVYYEDGTFKIQPGTVANFTGSVIKGASPTLNQPLESVTYRETYQLGCHVSGHAEQLTWLHSIVMFVLLRYKERLLEARGIERTVVNSSDFSKNEALGQENIFSRYLTLSGYVRHYWPKDRYQKISVVNTQFVIEQAERIRYPLEPQNQLWMGPDDAVDLGVLDPDDIV